MYDSEEEIKRKRRNLFLIIGIVLVVIFILLIIIISNSGSKKTQKEPAKMGCELEVKEGVAGANGTYSTQVMVGFKRIDVINKDYSLKSTIGTTDSPRNKETYTITKSGTYSLNGYVQDEMGNKGTCSINVVVSLSEPTCELEIKNGTEGENGWYTTDVEVGFKTMSSNSEATKIVKFYLEEEAVSLETGEDVTRADGGEKAEETLVVKKDQISAVKGYVIDSNGVIGTCAINVKKDAAAPTCKLKVESGTLNNSGQYTDNPVIGLAEAKDDVSDIAEKGVGVSKNYKETTYKVTAEGTTKVEGYVKDNAGNEGTCALEIKRPVTPKPTPTPTPTPTPSNPKLYDKVSVGDYVDYNAGVWQDGNGQVSTTNDSFSGFTAGQSKNNGITCDKTNDKGTTNGWRVLAKTNGKVLIVHAGTPECFYHDRLKDGNAAVQKMNERARGYINANYAEGASALSCTSTGMSCNLGGYVASMNQTGTHYYLATVASTGTTLYGVRYDGKVSTYGSRAYGYRPVVVLKSDVKTTGKNSSNAWVLTK